MKRCLAPLLLSLLLAACGSGTGVEVDFAEPFLAGTPDLAGFAVQHRGRYRNTTDTTEVLLLGSQHLLLTRQRYDTLTGPQLDSLALPRRARRQLSRYTGLWQTLGEYEQQG